MGNTETTWAKNTALLWWRWMSEPGTGQMRRQMGVSRGTRSDSGSLYRIKHELPRAPHVSTRIGCNRNGDDAMTSATRRYSARCQRAVVRLCTSACAALMLNASAVAAPPPANIGQLQQLNRANENALEDIQQRLDTRPSTERPSTAQRLLNRQQRTNQQMLQERQRRQLLLLNHQSRIDTRPGPPYSLRGIDMQRRFQRQQQNQLNRFRLQQGLRTR